MGAGNCRCSGYVLIVLSIFLEIQRVAGADDFDLPILRRIRVHSLSDRTAQDLEQIETSLRSPLGSVRREALETLENIVLKLDEYRQSFVNELVVHDRSFSESSAARLYERACEIYWQSWKEQMRRGEYASLRLLERLQPTESQARKWMAEIREQSPSLRQAVLELTAKENLSPETRTTFSSIAIRLFEKDLSPEVKAASLRALGRLKQPTPEGLAAMKQALTDPDLAKHAAIALAEWDGAGQSLASELRNALRTSDLETGAALLNTLRVVDPDPPVETLTLAKDILMDRESEKLFPEYRRMQEQAYLILERKNALPDPLPDHLASLTSWDEGLAEALEQAIESDKLPEVKRLLKLGAKFDRRSFRPLFRLYCLRGEIARVRTMIREPDFAKIDEFANYTTTKLCLENGKIEVVKFLLENIFLTDDSIWYLGELAVQQDRADVLLFLFEAKRNGKLIVDREKENVHYKALRSLEWALDHGQPAIIEAYLRPASEDVLLTIRDRALQANNHALAEAIVNWGRALNKSPLFYVNDGHSENKKAGSAHAPQP